ncbi:hypothetical protein Hanom_Chr12g01096551 [Helianthus anomalus]
MPLKLIRIEKKEAFKSRKDLRFESGMTQVLTGVKCGCRCLILSHPSLETGHRSSPAPSSSPQRRRRPLLPPSFSLALMFSFSSHRRSPPCAATMTIFIIINNITSSAGFTGRSPVRF